MRTEFKHSELCGCGSGQSYGRCCKNGRVKYKRDGRGTVFKSIAIDEEGAEAFREANARFRAIFGRKPGRKDRIFVDGYAYSAADLDRDMMKAFSDAETPKELAYAYSRTGLLVSGENSHLLSHDDLEEWKESIAEYIAASEEGIDLLEPSDGPVTLSLREFKELLNIIVIHLGSYADGSPKTAGISPQVFFNYLLVGKAHQCAKALYKGWESHLRTETFSLLRSVYECALLIRRLHEQHDFADTLFAQALVGNAPFSYRVKKNGEPDYSKIVNLETGEQFEGKTSYFDCARVASEDESIFFEVVYPFLSSNIHFDARDFISQYKKSGSFLIWETPNAPVQAIFILTVFAYLMISLRGSGGVPVTQKRDMRYLLERISKCFYGLNVALDEEDRDVDEHTSLVVFIADRLFRGEPLRAEAPRRQD